VRQSSVWERACGLTRSVVEDVSFEDASGAVVVSVRPNARARNRCGRCGRRSPGYDRGEGRRRWRALDLGTTKVFIEADAPRVRCRAHGPTVIAVPWARHGAGYTRDFDDLAAWLAVRTSKSAVCELLRIAWRTVGSIVTRVNADIDARVDRLDGLRRIGIDEISYKRGHRYLIVVVDHDTGRLVWAGPGRNDTALGVFFDQLGAERAAQLTHVSADMADWIARVVARRAPNAVRCADPFHVVAWAIDALDIERRRAWNAAAGRRPTPTSAPQPMRSAQPGAPSEPATRSGRTPRTSPNTSATNSTGSPKPTRSCGAPTCSKKVSATSSPPKATKANKHYTDGSPGPDDHGSRRSSTCTPRSPPITPPSTRPSSTAYRRA
jgi:transposase